MIKGLRVDHRLVHGQVAFTWTHFYAATRIIVIDDKSATDSSVARDTYNWNKTMSMAKQVCPDAVFLLSAGDQIDKSGASKSNDLKTRESEYAEAFR